MTLRFICALLVLCLTIFQVVADTAPKKLISESDWSETTLITTDEEWSALTVIDKPEGDGLAGNVVINVLPFNTIKIHEVQGTADQNLLDGQTVTVEAIVIGDFQNGDADDSRNLSGFFIQEEDVDTDGNAMTSEGIFVFENGNFITDVSVGDKVQVTGTADENLGETQINQISNITVIHSGNTLPSPSTINLPAANSTVNQSGDFQPNLEAFEGMLVHFPQTLTINEMFQLDRFNEIKLVQGNRPEQFTDTNTPDTTGFMNHLVEIGKRSITYDDGRNIQNSLIGNLDGFGPTFNSTSDIRMGDQITGLVGVLSYQWAGNGASGATWRVRSKANGDNVFTKVNQRAAVPSVGGDITVASINLLNFFTTLDENFNTCGPNNLSCRGADSMLEYERQIGKLISALSEIDADIFGFQELENHPTANPANDGTDPVLEAIVDSLNALIGPDIYDFVDAGVLGNEVIKVGLIYKTTKVNTSGNFQILDASVDGRFLDSKNRPALVQTFTEITTGELFTIAVNHFKSKGFNCSDVGDPDPNPDDGTGSCNGVRKAAAEALVDWLATDPTGSGDPDFLIIGDLNSYAMEEPIIAVKAGADDIPNTADDYVDLLNLYEGSSAYSFVFDGQTGYLDYALANNPLTAQITGVASWHINSDEPDALDYNLDFGRDANIFNEGIPFRLSDHDPMVIGLNLASPVSDCIQNIINVHTNLAASDQDIFRAIQTIESDAVLKTMDAIFFEAGNTIDLKIGFEVPVGSLFDASIQSCN